MELLIELWGLLWLLAQLIVATNARHLVADIDQITQDWAERLRVRKSSNDWALLDLVARRPVIDSATGVKELGVRQPNIYPPIRTLEDAGVLTSGKEHGLGTFWRSDEILAALDSLAERAGRRQAW